MSTAAEEALPTVSARRHPSLDRVCTWLEAIVHGREADALLQNPDALEGATGIALLPLWQWGEPLIDVGRKDRGYDGTTLLMPIRNDWPEGSLRLMHGESITAGYRIVGLGHTGAGQARIVQRGSSGTPSVPETTPSLSSPLFVGSSTNAQLLTALKRLKEAGENAKWTLIMDFVEPEVRKLARQAHAAVSYEIAGSPERVRPVLDDQGIEQVIDTMMLGDEDRQGRPRPGAVHRMVELCLNPDAFRKVEPLRFMDKHLRREAEAAIRRRLGDPHIGPKIRKVARAHPRADVEQVVELYRKTYPKDCLSAERAYDALSAGPDVMAGVTGLVMLNESTGTVEDAA